MSSDVIIFLIQSVDGGAGNRLCEAARHMSEDKHCHIVCYDGELPKDIINSDNITIHSVKVPQRLKGSILYSAYSLVLLLSIIGNTLGKKRWIGSFSSNAGLSVAILSPFINDQIFCVRRGANVRRLKLRIKNKYYTNTLTHIIEGVKVYLHKWMSKLMFLSSDLLISQTEAGVRQLEKEYDGWLPDRRAVLRNNVNATWIVRQRDYALDNPIKMQKNVFNVCFVGRIQIPTKGVDSFLHVAKSLENEDIKFHLVGDGPDMNLVKKYVDSEDIGNSVVIHGWVNNPLQIMCSSNLVVVPSRVDPCPNVVLESLSVATPVIGSDVDGISEMLSYPELLFDPELSSTISEKVLKAESCREYYESISKKCQDRCEKHKFDWSHNFEKILTNWSSIDGIYKPVDIR
jgi:glycosyltransferase involved in cell wall biosynthesis